MTRVTEHDDDQQFVKTERRQRSELVSLHQRSGSLVGGRLAQTKLIQLQ